MENNNKNDNNMENNNYMELIFDDETKKYEIEITGVKISESGNYYGYILHKIWWNWKDIETGETGECETEDYEWDYKFGAVYGDDEYEYVWEELEEKYGELDWEYDNLNDEQKKEYDELYKQYMEEKLQSLIDWYNEDIENMPETLFDMIADYMTEVYKWRNN